MANMELLNAAIAYIEAHPETWEQDQWRCDTGMCLAGWVATLGGARFVVSDEELKAGVGVSEEYYQHHTVALDRGPEHIEDCAWRLLAIDAEQADALFRAHNSLQDIKRLAARIAGSQD